MSGVHGEQPQPSSPVATDLDAISEAGITRIRRMASDTQESLDRLGSGSGTPRNGGTASPRHFANPMLTTRWVLQGPIGRRPVFQ